MQLRRRQQPVLARRALKEVGVVRFVWLRCEGAPTQPSVHTSLIPWGGSRAVRCRAELTRAGCAGCAGGGEDDDQEI